MKFMMKWVLFSRKRLLKHFIFNLLLVVLLLSINFLYSNSQILQFQSYYNIHPIEQDGRESYSIYIDNEIHADPYINLTTQFTDSYNFQEDRVFLQKMLETDDPSSQVGLYEHVKNIDIYLWINYTYYQETEIEVSNILNQIHILFLDFNEFTGLNPSEIYTLSQNNLIPSAKYISRSQLGNIPLKYHDLIFRFEPENINEKYYLVDQNNTFEASLLNLPVEWYSEQYLVQLYYTDEFDWKQQISIAERGISYDTTSYYQGDRYYSFTNEHLLYVKHFLDSTDSLQASYRFLILLMDLPILFIMLTRNEVFMREFEKTKKAQLLLNRQTKEHLRFVSEVFIANFPIIITLFASIFISKFWTIIIPLAISIGYLAVKYAATMKKIEFSSDFLFYTIIVTGLFSFGITTLYLSISTFGGRMIEKIGAFSYVSILFLLMIGVIASMEINSKTWKNIINKRTNLRKRTLLLFFLSALIFSSISMEVFLVQDNARNQDLGINGHSCYNTVNCVELREYEVQFVYSDISQVPFKLIIANDMSRFIQLLKISGDIDYFNNFSPSNRTRDIVISSDWVHYSQFLPQGYGEILPLRIGNTIVREEVNVLGSLDEIPLTMKADYWVLVDNEHAILQDIDLPMPDEVISIGFTTKGTYLEKQMMYFLGTQSNIYKLLLDSIILLNYVSFLAFSIILLDSEQTRLLQEMKNLQKLQKTVQLRSEVQIQGNGMIRSLVIVYLLAQLGALSYTLLQDNFTVKLSDIPHTALGFNFRYLIVGLLVEAGIFVLFLFAYKKFQLILQKRR